MQIEKTKIDELSAELSIVLQPEDYQPRVEKALKDYRKRVQLPGFRIGQVPASLVKQRFGKSILAEEVNLLLQDSIYKYINENKIEILGSPIPAKEDLDAGDWNNPGDFRFTYELGLAPSFEVNLNKDLSLTYYKVNVNDELIDRQVKDLARRYGKMSASEISDEQSLLLAELTELDESGNPKEDGIKNNSHVTIEYIKDKATKDALTGLKIGDSITINPHKLSENHEDLASMLGVSHEEIHHLANEFRLTVSEIKNLEPSELSKELFDKLFADGNVTNEEDLRARVAADLEKMFTRDADFLLKRNFVKAITEKLNLQLPDEFLKKYINLTNDKPLTEDVLEREYPAYAGQLKWELIEDKLIREFELKVSEEDAMRHVKQVLQERYASYGLPIEDEELLASLAKETLSKKEEAKNVYDFLYEERIIELVKDKCTLTEERIPMDDFISKIQH